MNIGKDDNNYENEFHDEDLHDDEFHDEDFEDEDFEDEDFEDEDFEDEDFEDEDFEDEDFEDEDFEDTPKAEEAEGTAETGGIKCPACGTKNPLIQKKCIRCNNLLFQPVPSANYSWKADDEFAGGEEYSGPYERELDRKTVQCMSCGTDNDIERRNCRKCNNILIKPFDFIEKSLEETGLNFRESAVTISALGCVSYVITPHLSTLMKSAMGFMDGNVTVEEYKKAIKTQRYRVEKALEKLPEVARKLIANKRKDTTEIADLLKIGLEEYVEALDMLENYFLSEDFEDITDGLEMAKEANHKVYKVKVLSGKISREGK